MGLFVGLCIVIRGKDDLSESLAIAEVDEDEPSMVPSELYPPHQADVLVQVVACEHSATVGPPPSIQILKELL
jgi:hypothetical protein